MGASDFSLVLASAVEKKGKKRGQIPKIWARAQRPPRGGHPFSSPDYLSVRFARLFFPNGESGPGFKYEFINRRPLPRFFFSSFSK